MEAEKAVSSGGSGDAFIRTPRAIILEPARELAEQVAECLTAFKVGQFFLMLSCLDVWGICGVRYGS